MSDLRTAPKESTWSFLRSAWTLCPQPLDQWKSWILLSWWYFLSLWERKNEFRIIIRVFLWNDTSRLNLSQKEGKRGCLSCFLPWWHTLSSWSQTKGQEVMQQRGWSTVQAQSKWFHLQMKWKTKRYLLEIICFISRSHSWSSTATNLLFHVIKKKGVYICWESEGEKNSNLCICVQVVATGWKRVLFAAELSQLGTNEGRHQDHQNHGTHLNSEANH